MSLKQIKNKNTTNIFAFKFKKKPILNIMRPFV